MVMSMQEESLLMIFVVVSKQAESSESSTVCTATSRGSVVVATTSREVCTAQTNKMLTAITGSTADGERTSKTTRLRGKDHGV